MMTMDYDPREGSARQNDPMVHAATEESRWPVRMTVLAVVVVAGALLAYGGAGSYESLSHLAASHGVPIPWLAPAGLDGGLAGTVILDMTFTLLGRPVFWLRIAARLFAASTVAFNAWSGWPDPVGVTMRVFAPALILVITEAVRQVLRWEQQEHVHIPVLRWVLAPKPTFRIWRRMKLWGLASYRDAIELELDVRHSITKLREHYGRYRDWRASAPAELVWMLDHGVRMQQALEMVAAITDKRPEPVASAPPPRKAASASGKRKQRAASNAKSVRPADWDTDSAALAVLVRDPSISGSQLGREIGVDPSYGRVLKNRLMEQVQADRG
jgi:hypothetical protein